MSLAFTHSNGTAVIQGADCALFGLIILVADDVGEICEKHVLVRSGLFAHFVAVLSQKSPMTTILAFGARYGRMR